MTGELFRGKSRLAGIVMHRSGTRAEIYRPDGTATENKYGKVPDPEVSFTKVGEATSRRVYQSYDERPREAGTIGGRVDSENPRLLFPSETDVQEGDEIVYTDDNKRYKIDEFVSRETHDEYRSTLVN